MNGVRFCEVAWGSGEYDQAVALRDEVLRRPLGMVLTDEQRDGEQSDRHFVLLEEDRVVACVIATPRKQGEIKIRQMAVAEHRRRSGLGSRLIREAEPLLAASGATRLYLHSRADAVGFYERLGYRPEGEGFLEVGIPHRLMAKKVDG